MSSMLAKGGNAPLTGNGPFTVTVTHQSGPELDLTAFLLTAGQKVRGDQDMVFYNQPAGSGATWIADTKSGNSVTHSLIVDPASWPNDIERVRIGLTAANTTFGAVNDLQAQVTDASGTVIVIFDLTDRGAENAFIVGDIYHRAGSLKVRCEAAGFTNGLAGLGKDVGVDIEDEPHPEVKTATVNFVKKLAETPPPAGASDIDMRKHKLAVVLVKNNLDGKIFRVVLLIDASGSMYRLYEDNSPDSGSSLFGSIFGRDHSTKGGGSVVQRTLEKMVPIADLFDDNHEMEVIFFADIPVWSEPVRAEAKVSNVNGYVARNMKTKRKAGYGNDEVPAMRAVQNWVRQNPSPYPTVVLAWSDGGVGNENAIKRFLVEVSSDDIFWMWLGLGGTPSSYGVLSRLDKVTGGVVDNCGFIHIDDIETMKDEDLYEKIMAFIGKWYREAKAAGVIAASH